MITIVLNSGYSEDLKRTVNNLIVTQKNKLNKIHVLVTCRTCEGDEDVADVVKNYAGNIDIKLGCSEYENKYIVWNELLEKISTKYVMFVEAGAEFAGDVIELACDKLAVDDKLDMISLRLDEHIDIEKQELAKSAVGMGMRRIDLAKEPESIPVCIDPFIFRTSAIKDKRFDESLKYDADKLFLYEVIAKKSVYGVATLKGIKKTMLIAQTLVSNIYANTFATDRAWYIHSIENYLLKVIELFKNKESKIPVYIQYLVIYELKWKYLQNWNARNQHLYDDDTEELVAITSKVLACVDEGVIINNLKAPILNMTKIQSKLFLKIKLGDDYKPTFIKWIDKMIYTVNGNGLVQVAMQNIVVDILEYDKENLIIEGTFDSVINPEDYKIICRFNSEEIPVKEVYRYSHTKCFGESISKNYTFRVTYPIEKIGDKKNIRFFIKIGDDERILKFRTKRYTAKLTSLIPKAYYIENGYCHEYVEENTKMLITKYKSGMRFKKEIRYLAHMLVGAQSSEKMFLMRLVYWITRPFYKNKNIWISYDKLYKGGDCGEYIHRYASEQGDGVKSVYVINKNAVDVKRILGDKVKVSYFGTIRQKLNFLNANVILSTHSGTHTFNSITNQQIPYLMDLIKSFNVCIQHGLTVQQLAQEQNYVFNNTKRYYCASKYEIENLSKPIYGYEDKSIMRLTGIPRFDGLVSNDKKQILITPTWRNYISMPAQMGQVRPYNPNFKNTDYFTIYNTLLKDKRLKKVAKETGYKLIYLIHPVITSQVEDYESGDGIELLTADVCNYEQLLTESSLMLTDYSGVQFDFAYMRKPVVYYHPPKLPPHYKEGGFIYETMGFGEICTEHEQLVDILCDYMKNSCEVKPEFKDRQDDFFAYNDIESCKRIYDDILEYQKEIHQI